MRKKVKKTISDFLADQAVHRKPKKKVRPELQSLQKEVDSVVKACLALQEAKIAFNAARQRLLEKVTPAYEEHARSGKFSKTFDVAGEDTPGVQVSYKDCFRIIPLEKEVLLKKMLGDRYDYFFFQAREISLKDVSDATVTVLLAKLGPEDFKKFFSIELWVGTQPDMDQKQFELPDEIRLTAVQQYQPSLKLRKEEE